MIELLVTGGDAYLPVKGMVTVVLFCLFVGKLLWVWKVC